LELNLKNLIFSIKVVDKSIKMGVVVHIMEQEGIFALHSIARLSRSRQGGGVFRYMENSDAKENNLKKIRIELGLTITALSRLANVSTKVISQTERMLTDPTPVTKSKIIKGLNDAGSSISGKWEYKDIFPNDGY
jgi:DNA-binding XRE family transcriptional regulator